MVAYLRRINLCIIVHLTCTLFAVAQTHPADTTKLHYPVRKTIPATLDDLRPGPVDFKNPRNLKTVVEYDAANNMYRVHIRLGKSDLAVPLLLTPEEYAAWKMKRSMHAWFREKNAKETTQGKHEFDFMDERFNPKPLDKIFGPGGVKIRMQGTVDLKTGMRYSNVQNPTLPENMRKTWQFDFDPKINANVGGSVGEKVNLDMNYNTDATFDFDSKKLKLSYEGHEDDIIQLLEAGNVSMTTNNSLIRGASALFGIRADLQFGKLKLQTVVSQQESEARTVTSKGGVQTTPFEFSADRYDENRHFFLAHYFRDTYDKNMSQLPTILSGVKINRIEVWVTNKRGNYENPRNLVAFTDMAENKHISRPDLWQPSGSIEPRNDANSLYSLVTTAYTGLRNVSEVNGIMNSIGAAGGTDYEKIESARLLASTDYMLNESLGYISLKQALQPDEVLAVAFEYTLAGRRYQVGEFSSDIKESASSLYVKLLKSTSNSPRTGCWPLMMKNVYALNANQVQQEKFRLDITYLSDTAGVYLKYIPDGKINRVPLLKVMNLDRLDSRNQPGADGFFDFVPGYTITVQNGRVIFPVVEPFGSHLRKMIANDAVADKYVFQELYDSTLTVARQTAEKNKFRLQGEFKASSGTEIRLGAMNVPPGSVVVMAGGVTLTEFTDYTVDYVMGVVTIINQSIIDAGTPISVNLESLTLYNMMRKTMLGMNFTYDFSRDFQFGGTIMHLREKPYTTKVAMGSEPISNTLWGVNLSWKKQSQWLTNMIDKLPFVTATQPSTINFMGEFAHLIPGHNKNIQGDASYIDDFESTQSGIDLKQPAAWMLASTPWSGEKGMFPEASKTNDIEYGKNRALLSWYYIDRLFTRRNSSLTPSHIKNDEEQLSNHYVREVYEQEIFPNKEALYQQSPVLPVLNMAYYPKERGPYNLDTEMLPDGKLRSPAKRWGGMMRKLDTSDFEAANIEYIEFWLLDPFIYENKETTRQGGDLYINLGEVSEDILKDGRKFFENGLPVDGNLSRVDETVWGRVPRDRSVVYAFDNTGGARKRQDVGLNGLSTADEQTFPTYADYLNKVRAIVDSQTYQKFLDDPAGDNYHYYRGTDYDLEQRSILDRYKYYNNTEGNSTAADDSPEKYDISAKTVPDVEDINQDNTLNENEKYFQYKINLRPGSLQVGTNYITDKRTANVNLRNGDTEEVTWYQFKVPVQSGTSVGGISDFKSIRFMRVFLTDFEQDVVLRFGTFQLVRGEWRTYTEPLDNSHNPAPSVTGTLEVSKVNIEENGSRTPVNYVLPPGVSRVIDPGQPQLRQQNEQSLSLKVQDLAAGDARAVYKNTGMDMRRYKRLQMFVHAEKLLSDDTQLEHNELSVFIRLGSDYRSNYYEYEIPLSLTEPGNYSGLSTIGALAVWPESNMLDIPLSLFTNLKLERNKKKSDPDSGVTYGKLYSGYDPEKSANKVSIIGNPSLAEVRTIMIGIRNNARSKKSGEVWVNELRLTEFDEDGGWAARGNLNVQLSDIGNVNVGGHVETAGFGGLEQSVSERRLDDYYQYSFTTNFELGRFLPAKAKISVPVYFSYSKEKVSPKYNPLDKDILLKDALDILETRQEKDSLRSIAEEIVTYKNFSLSNMRVGIASKKPMPYDPANFSFSYAYTRKFNSGNTTKYEDEKDWRGSMNYSYTPVFKPWEPFKKMKNKSPWLRFIKDFNLNWLPQNIAFNTDISRHYYELQLRDVENVDSGVEIPLSFAKQFLWNRDFAIRWNFSKGLRMDFTSATHAEIEEPYGAVNKELYPDEYSEWKDEVKRSLLSLGRPLDYKQTFNLSYQLPLDKFPVTDWMTTDVRFASSYNWDRGIALLEGPSAGNTISNQRMYDINGRVNMELLYNKVSYLKDINRRGWKPEKDNFWGKVGHYALRMAMMTRNFSIAYRNTFAMSIPGFLPDVGDMFGQKKNNGFLAPGLDFAFGLAGFSYVEKAQERGWLIGNDSITSPARTNSMEDIQFRMTLEPLPDLKVDLNASRTRNNTRDVQYMYDDMPETRGGNFTMTVITIGSAFEGSDASSGYRSKSFERFVDNLDIIQKRVEAQYNGAIYPEGTKLAGQTFDTANGTVNKNSPDVMIPAFFAAYTGRDAGKTSLNLFPNLLSLMPNWRINYSGLVKLPFLQKHFQAFNLNHAYRSTYSIGSYNTYQSFLGYMGDLGFIEDVQSGMPIPSGRYDIGTVSINEQFNPLFGIDMTLHNGVTFKAEYKTTRVLNLSMAANQVIESRSKDLVFGAGYKVLNWNPFKGRNRKNSKNVVSNDLILRTDVSFRNQSALSRDVQLLTTQPTTGNRALKISCTADYVLSKMLTLRLYYDRQQNTPLVSNSYPVITSDFGVSMRFTLTH